MIIKLSVKLGIKVGCGSAKVELEYRVETQTEGEVEIGMETQCEGQDVEVKMGRGANGGSDQYSGMDRKSVYDSFLGSGYTRMGETSPKTPQD
jgi:hypothetical protein